MSTIRGVQSRAICGQKEAMAYVTSTFKVMEESNAYNKRTVTHDRCMYLEKCYFSNGTCSALKL